MRRRQQPGQAVERVLGVPAVRPRPRPGRCAGPCAPAAGPAARARLPPARPAGRPARRPGPACAGDEGGGEAIARASERRPRPGRRWPPRSRASWWARACCMAAGCCSQRVVLPSMSVNRKVTVPVGKGGGGPAAGGPAAGARPARRPAAGARAAPCPLHQGRVVGGGHVQPGDQEPRPGGWEGRARPASSLRIISTEQPTRSASPSCVRSSSLRRCAQPGAKREILGPFLRPFCAAAWSPYRPSPPFIAFLTHQYITFIFSATTGWCFNRDTRRAPDRGHPPKLVRSHAMLEPLERTRPPICGSPPLQRAQEAAPSCRRRRGPPATDRPARRDGCAGCGLRRRRRDPRDEHDRRARPRHRRRQQPHAGGRSARPGTARGLRSSTWRARRRGCRCRRRALITPGRAVWWPR